MTMMQEDTENVSGGVDTHGDVHVAAVIDQVGRILGTHSFRVNPTGYLALLTWMTGFGRVDRVGVEGTGSYGAGLARFLAGREIKVVEVNRPDRQLRRRRGKSDPTDAESAARAALNGEAGGAPKSGDGPVESIRVLRVARRSAVKARTQAALQIRDLIVTAPAAIHEQLHPLDTNSRVEVCARYRPGTPTADPLNATKEALRFLAQRHQHLTDEIEHLDTMIAGLCAEANPALLGAQGVGPEVAATLLVTAGDNPERMGSQSSFAALCGVNPVEASSGKVVRHRLNRGGNRQANNALWRIVMVRRNCDQRTRNYFERRRAEGKSEREITRCLKRHIAREVFKLLVNPPAVPTGADLRHLRINAHIALAPAAEALGSYPTTLSRLERGLDHNTTLATDYQEWLNNHSTAA